MTRISGAFRFPRMLFRGTNMSGQRQAGSNRGARSSRRRLALPPEVGPNRQPPATGPRKTRALCRGHESNGGRFDGKCSMRIALPDFKAERIAVGQWGHGVERAWDATRFGHMRDTEEPAPSDPAARRTDAKRIASIPDRQQRFSLSPPPPRPDTSVRRNRTVLVTTAGSPKNRRCERQ